MLNVAGPRSSKENWKDRSGRSDGKATRDEERNVSLAQQQLYLQKNFSMGQIVSRPADVLAFLIT